MIFLLRKTQRVVIWYKFEFNWQILCISLTILHTFCSKKKAYSLMDDNFVNYPTLSDGASCESSQPVRETFVLRSAVCRSSSSQEDGPSTWHSVIGNLSSSITLYGFVKFYCSFTFAVSRAG